MIDEISVIPIGITHTVPMLSGPLMNTSVRLFTAVS
jgi:hypothetical protein